MSVLNSVHSKLTVTPVDGAVSPATAHVKHAAVLVRQTAIFVLVGTILYMDSALWLTAPWDSTLMVREATIILLIFFK